MGSIPQRSLVDVQRRGILLFIGWCMALHTVEHGGRALAFARARNIDYRDVLDFSANINPLGPSPRVIDLLRKSLDSIQIYPDEATEQLTKRLAADLHLPQSHILAGNG